MLHVNTIMHVEINNPHVNIIMLLHKIIKTSRENDGERERERERERTNCSIILPIQDLLN